MATRRGPDNSVRIAIGGTMNGIAWANVFYCQLATSSAIIQADLDTWTTAFQAAYKTRFAPVQRAEVLYALAKAVCFTPGITQVTSSIAMTGAGTEAGTLVSDNGVSKVVSWLSPVYWRGGKPRTYLPGVAVTDVTTSTVLTGAAITAVKTAAGNFRTDINALTAGTITGTQLGFVSFSSGNVPRGTPLFFAFSGATVHPRLGSQRRRLGRWTN
jgi:hypothetical protein